MATPIIDAFGWYRAIDDELTRAYEKHGRDQWGRHEFYAILLEEVDELWTAIKDDEPQNRVQAEAIQIAAVVIRYLETGDRYREPEPCVCGHDHNCARTICSHNDADGTT